MQHITFKPKAGWLAILFLTGLTVISLAGSTDKTTILRDTPFKQNAWFRQNKGQWDDAILYRGGSYKANVHFLKNGLSFAFIRKNEVPTESGDASEYIETMVWNIDFINCNPNSTIVAKGKTDSKTNYLIGNDRTRWAFNVPDYNELTYSDIYHHIDLRYYPVDYDLKYEYILKPGGDIRQIQMAAKGIEKLNINRKGELEINTPWGILTEKRPYSYQIIEGVKKEVDVRYEIKSNNVYGFKIYGNYNPLLELVIDPIILKYSTFVGGAYKSDGYVEDIKLDKNKCVYGVGLYGDKFPITPGVYDSTYNGPNNYGAYDVYVYKMNPAGSNLIFATYIGGNNDDKGSGIDIGPNGEIYISGFTWSTNFPVTGNACQPNNAGQRDFFAAKLSADGKQLLYSTYLGGSAMDHNNNNVTGGYWQKSEIAVTPTGEIAMVGTTMSKDFPVKNAAQSVIGGNPTGNAQPDAFVAKIDPNGGTLVFASYLGGNREDRGYGLDVDNNGNIYIAGFTARDPMSAAPTGFPITVGVVQPAQVNIREGFLAKFSPTGTLIYSTYTGDGEGRAIEVNANQEAYVVAGKRIFKMNANASAYIYDKTIIPNGFIVIGTDIAVTSDGEAFAVGYTDSGTLQSICTNISSFKGNPMDAYVVKLDPTGSTIEYASYFGGSYSDYYPSVDLLEDPCLIEVALAVTTHSPNFPTTPGSFRPVKINEPPGGPNNNDTDMPTTLVLKAEITPDFVFTPPVCLQPVQFTDKSKGDCVWKPGPWTPTSWKWDFGDGGTSTVQNPIHTFPGSGTYHVKLVVGCPYDSIVIPVTIPTDPSIQLDLGPDTILCKGAGSITLDAKNPGFQYSWSNGATTHTITVNTSGVYTVKIDKGDACSMAKDSIKIQYIDPPIVNLAYTPVCNGDTITLDAGNPGANYSWNTTATTQKIKITTAGNYFVTANIGACLDRDTIDVVFNPGPVIGLRDTSLCGLPGTQITLDAGNPGATYTWNTGATTRQIMVSGTNEYIVTVTSSGCKNTDTSQVTFLSKPTIQLPNDTTICGNTSLLLNAGNPGAAYIWSTGATTDTITAFTAGKYIVTVTLPGGCEGSDSIVIQTQMPPVKTLRDTIFCDQPGSKVILDAQNPGAFYLWNDGAITQSIVVSNPGTYYVTITNGICQITDSSDVEKVPLPVLNLTDVAVCGPSIIQLDALNPGAAYLWSSGETTQTISTAQNGSYTVTVTLGICTVTSSATIIHHPIPMVQLPADTVMCGYNAIKLDAQNPGSMYLWNTGATDQLISVEKSGTYIVNVTNGFNCIGSDTINIEYQLPPELGPDLSLCDQESTVLDAGINPGASYLWNTGETTQQIQPFKNGTYYVTVTRGICLVGDTISITGEFGLPSLYIPNSFTPNGDGRNELFTALGADITDFKMDIFNRWGELYFQTNNMARGWDGKYNGNVVQEDVYIYIIEYKTTCGSKESKVRKLGHVSVIR